MPFFFKKILSLSAADEWLLPLFQHTKSTDSIKYNFSNSLGEVCHFHIHMRLAVEIIPSRDDDEYASIWKNGKIFKNFANANCSVGQACDKFSWSKVNSHLFQGCILGCELKLYVLVLVAVWFSYKFSVLQPIFLSKVLLLHNFPPLKGTKDFCNVEMFMLC